MNDLYTCTMLPDAFRDNPPKYGVRDNESGVIAVFYDEAQRASYLEMLKSFPDLLNFAVKGEKNYLLEALILCERALEERDTELEEYAGKKARAAIAKATQKP